MASFKNILLASAIILGVAAFPGHHHKRQTITSSESGTNNGYFYQFWTNGGGTVEYQNGDAGEYSVTWVNDGDFTAGKGWATGSDRYGKFNMFQITH